MSQQYVQEIFRFYDEAEKHLAGRSIEVDDNQLRKTFANVYSPSPRYQFIFDFPSLFFDYVRDKTYSLLDIQPNCFIPEALFNKMRFNVINNS